MDRLTQSNHQLDIMTCICAQWQTDRVAYWHQSTAEGSDWVGHELCCKIQCALARRQYGGLRSEQRRCVDRWRMNAQTTEKKLRKKEMIG